MSARPGSAGPRPAGSALPVVAAVALGGAVGALGRAGIAQVLPAGGDDGFPTATLLVNLIGSALLALALRRPLPPVLGAALRTGVLGAFTTFSAFAVETAVLAERAPLQALGYVVASLGGGLLAATVASASATSEAA